VSGRPLHVTLYTPHTAQWALHQSPARFRVATCGRRWGKTLACVNELAYRALARPDGNFAWIAPTYHQAKIAFRWMVKEFRPAFAEPPSVSELRIPWRSGSVVQCLSADNFDALRGHGYHGVVGDEFASWPREAWEEVIRPTLSDTNGWALLVGTPKGRNLFWELWMRGQDPATWPDYASWQFPTASNPYIPAAEIAEAQHSLPFDVFRQEYTAEFLDDVAGVFRNVAACVAGDYEPIPVNGHQYVLGWDPAKHADMSVVTVLDLVTRHVVAWERWLHVDYTIQMERIATICHRYNATVLMDSTGVGDPLLEALLARGVPTDGFQFTNTTKQQLVEHLAVQIEQRTVTWPDNPVLQNELVAFQYEMTRAGNVRYSAPDGMHDDAVMSLALAVWAAKGGGGEALALGTLAKIPERLRWADL
jgi:hypothetical protein